MDWAFDITLKNRVIFKNFLETYSLEELNKVPKGFNNNIIWNVAHTIVTQQLLVYNLSGLPMLVPNNLVEMYRKGTKPECDVTQAEVDTIKSLLFSTLEKTQEDYGNKLFKNYTEYTVTTKCYHDCGGSHRFQQLPRGHSFRLYYGFKKVFIGNLKNFAIRSKEYVFLLSQWNTEQFRKR